MSFLIRNLFSVYNYYFYELKDARSENLFLMQDPPILICLILAGYVLMIKFGPKFMESKRPFELKKILVAYNLFQVIFNLILCVYGTYNQTIAQTYNFGCQPVNYSSNFQGLMELKLVYFYFLLKVLDLFDTLFIILKKNKLTVLHCYHHFIMALCCWICVRYFPGGHVTFLGMINTFVHSIMYFYFYLTSLKPEMKKSIWWKKHITHIQMAQFMIMIIHFTRGAFTGGCNFPKTWMWFLVIQNVFMLVLFANFYIKTYIIKRKLF